MHHQEEEIESMVKNNEKIRAELEQQIHSTEALAVQSKANFEKSLETLATISDCAMNLLRNVSA
jgi:hypothetical protein